MRLQTHRNGLQTRHAFRQDAAIDQFVEDDARDLVAIGIGRPQTFDALRFQSLRIDLALHQPRGAGDADSRIAARLRFMRDDLGDVQPRQRAARQYAVQRLMDGVVGADQKFSAGTRELVGRIEHQVGHTIEVAAFERFDIPAQRMRMHRDFGVSMRTQQGGAFDAEGAITQRRAFGRKADDADMRGRFHRVVKSKYTRTSLRSSAIQPSRPGAGSRGAKNSNCANSSAVGHCAMAASGFT